MTPAGPVSSSAPSCVGLRDKVREDLKLTQLWAQRFLSGGDADRVVSTVEEYAEIYGQETGREFSSAAIFEIGFGARPLRMMVLHGLGFDAQGVDLECPILGGGPVTMLAIMRRHGVERAIKSTLRSLVFDRRDIRSLENSMSRLGAKPRLLTENLLIGDASKLNLRPNSLDFIVSEDVFEHIESDALTQLVDQMVLWLRPSGLALIRPFVYTGISGNHLVDWYPHRVLSGKLPRATDPWEHLRRDRVDPNTYLNRLTRADYRCLFSRRFHIVREHVRYPDLGRHLLTPSVAAELSGWADDELFSNSVQFVLRPKQPDGHVDAALAQ